MLSLSVAIEDDGNLGPSSRDRYRLGMRSNNHSKTSGGFAGPSFGHSHCPSRLIPILVFRASSIAMLFFISLYSASSLSTIASCTDFTSPCTLPPANAPSPSSIPSASTFSPHTHPNYIKPVENSLQINRATHFSLRLTPILR